MYSTWVLFPHKVPKCCLLGFVIECLKFDDPVHFQYDLHVYPHTFDILVPLIEDHPVFQTDSQTPQLPVAYQLGIPLSCSTSAGVRARIVCSVALQKLADAREEACCTASVLGLPHRA